MSGRARVIEVGITIRIINVGGARCNDLLLVRDEASEGSGVLHNSGRKVILPLNHLVVLDHDVVAKAAGFTFVGRVIECFSSFLDFGVGADDLAVNGHEHLSPQLLEVKGELLVDLPSALLAWFTNIGQSGEAAGPGLDEVSDNLSGKGLSRLLSEELVLLESLPLVATVVLGDKLLDLIVGPHIVDFIVSASRSYWDNGINWLGINGRSI